MASVIKPKSIAAGSRIGLFSPAYYFSAENTAEAKSYTESLGFEVYIHPQTLESDMSLAGNPESRVQALHDLIKDPSIDAIMCTTGGYGSIQLLEMIDYDLIGNNPKIISGYSDNTLLLAAIHKKTGLVTFHGPNARQFLSSCRNEDTTQSYLQVTSGGMPRYDFPMGTYTPQVINSGDVEAPLNGGNHAVLTSLIGTEYLPDYDGCIFFTESNKPMFYTVDQNITHLRLSKVTKNIKGFILGEMAGQHYIRNEDSHMRFNLPFDQVIKKHFPATPAVIDFPCGHEQTLLTFPLGIKHRLTLCDDGQVTLTQTESACI